LTDPLRLGNALMAQPQQPNPQNYAAALMNPNLMAQGQKYRANMTPPESVMDPRWDAHSNAQKQADTFMTFSGLPGPAEIATGAKALAAALKGGSAANLAIFAGPAALMADKIAFSKAQSLEKGGATPEQIWSQTGWFKGPEGKWRFEINDKPSQWRPEMGSDIAGRIDSMNTSVNGATIGNTFSHPALMASYPELSDITLMHSASGNPGASFNGSGITLESVNGYAAKDKLQSRTLHELQHAIQGKEGFARGGNPALVQQEINQSLDSLRQEAGDMSFGRVPYSENRMQFLLDKQKEIENRNSLDEYRRLAGEAEARAVQARMNMTHAERQATPPWVSYDVPWDKLIVR